MSGEWAEMSQRYRFLLAQDRAAGLVDDEPCMCGTDFTCMSRTHLICPNCGISVDVHTCQAVER